MNNFETQCNTYGDLLRKFLGEHHKLKGPIDHLAYKCADGQDFHNVMMEWLPECLHSSYIILNNRKLASVHLRDPIDLGDLGSVAWLEIMEPRPNKVGHDFVGVEHTEIVKEDLEQVARYCDDNKIPYTRYSNPRHSAIVVALSSDGHEVKFTDTAMADIVSDQHQAGESYTVKE